SCPPGGGGHRARRCRSRARPVALTCQGRALTDCEKLGSRGTGHTPMTELASGSSLGRYQLLVTIGQGGMASVWVASERGPMSGKQRLVAVKAMLPELARRP